MSQKPAECLEGTELERGWKVVEIIKPAPSATGGKFSVGYLVKNMKGKEAYLKALDFSGAFQAANFTVSLQSMTEAYNFERDLLLKCKSHRLSRIVTPIDYGETVVSGFGHFGKVCYLIFEKAEGDIRQQSRHLQKFDLSWCLRSLHNTAVGLKQLHSKWIVHQDLKPSNILVFKRMGIKIADLGRASDKSMKSPFDNKPIAGDMGYAPIELFYGFKITDEFQMRFGIDMYLLGSLIFFYFSDVSATQAINAKLIGNPGINLSRASFENDLPYIKNAFFEAIKDLEENIKNIAGEVLAEELIILVKQLCEPDPRLRGDPKNIGTLVSQYDLQRFISKFNLLAKQIELGIK